MPRYIIDRFEGELAVLEAERGAPVRLPRTWLPAGARAGDAIAVEVGRSGEGSTIGLAIDEQARRLREDSIREIRSEIPSGPEGDLDL